MISELKPRVVWKYFNDLLGIPRASRHLGQVTEYIINFADKHSLSYEQDAAGNIVISKPATELPSTRKTILLQGHLDMVSEKADGVKHDFINDVINAYEESGWVKARGTTLGSDNGMGVAAMLGILASKEIEHGPIKALFTTDEEVGLVGAFALDASLIQGCDVLLNLDTEEEGDIYIGSAGGFDSELVVPLKRDTSVETLKSIMITIGGMKGGHSGVDIHLNRGNANIILVELLQKISEKYSCAVMQLSGGGASNAIPRSASAQLYTDMPQQELDFLVEGVVRKIQEDPSSDCPNFAITLGVGEGLEQSGWSGALAYDLIKVLPNGVIKMSPSIEGLVETSLNIASLRLERGHLHIVVSARSSSQDELTFLRREIERSTHKHEGKVTFSEEYGGWEPDVDSKALKVASEVYRDIFGKEAYITAIHAGLECAILKEKSPRLDVISFGPTIKYPHSPDEKVHIESVDKFWRLLVGILKKI